MAEEEKLPPLTADTSLDVILLVQFSRTLADLGIYGFWLYANCSTHGDIQMAVFGDQPPSQRTVGCGACYRAGITRTVTVEDMRAF